MSGSPSQARMVEDEDVILFANMYGGQSVGGIVGYLYASKEKADEAANGNRIACLRFRVKRDALPKGVL